MYHSRIAVNPAAQKHYCKFSKNVVFFRHVAQGALLAATKLNKLAMRCIANFILILFAICVPYENQLGSSKT
jgi:hypothetical protein